MAFEIIKLTYLLTVCSSTNIRPNQYVSTMVTLVIGGSFGHTDTSPDARPVSCTVKLNTVRTKACIATYNSDSCRNRIVFESIDFFSSTDVRLLYARGRLAERC